MADTKNKKPAIVVDPSVAAAAAAASGTSGSTASVTSAKAQANTPLRNDYGFVVNGKVPTTITLSQLKTALGDTTNNAPAIQRMAVDVAKVPGTMANLGSVTSNGSLTPIEQNVLSNYALSIVNTTPKGQLASVMDAVTKKINPQSINPYAVSSTINLKSVDRPDIAAVKSTVNDLYEQLLGKKADDATVAKWAQVYDNYAASRPTSQTTGGITYGLQSVPTATGGASNRLIRSGQTEKTVTNQLTAENFIKNQIVDSGDYKAFQASGAAMNLLNNMAAKEAGVA
jgi:hypothetical protein